LFVFLVGVELFPDDIEFGAEFLVEFSQEFSGYGDVSIDSFTVITASYLQSFGNLAVVVGQKLSVYMKLVQLGLIGCCQLLSNFFKLLSESCMFGVE